VIADEQEIMRGEMDQYGYSHAQVGAIMAKRWGLPREIANAIYYHHQPGEAGEFAFIARIIDVADQLANKAGWGIRRLAEDYDISLSESAICLKLEKEQLDATWERTTKSLELMLEKLK
jgi:HD-like signal output (HDOD) protein